MRDVILERSIKKLVTQCFVFFHTCVKLYFKDIKGYKSSKINQLNGFNSQHMYIYICVCAESPPSNKIINS